MSFVLRISPRRAAGALLILYGSATPLDAQPARLSAVAPAEVGPRIDAIFAVHDRPDGPGCAVGVSVGGELVFAQGYGMASLEHGLPITPRTAFDIGSVAKQFTALAVLLLEQQGRVSLDDDVRRYVPELPDYGTPVTLRDLLQHTSGVRDYGTLEVFSGRAVRTMGDFIELVARQRALNFVPGERHEYSHSDYSLLAFAIERVAGEPFGQFLEREVLKPSGMVSSRVHDSRGVPVHGRASAHAATPDGYRVRFPGNEVVGGAKLYTTVEDLLRWERNFHEPAVGGRAVIDRLLERPTLASGAVIPYAFGLRLGEYRGLRTVHRSGGGSFASEMLRFPDQGLAVVTLCNVTPSHPRYLSEEVAELFLSEQMHAVAADDTIPISPAPGELERLAGVFRPVDTPWNIVRISRHNDALHEIAFPDTSPPLRRMADGRYELDGLFYRFVPVDGGPLRLQLETDQVLEVLERIAESELWAPTVAALDEYAGSFYSPDIDAFWEFLVLNDELVLRSRSAPERALAPALPDVFTRNLGTYERPVYTGLHFDRDGAGSITGVVVTTPSGDDAVKGLRFERIGPVHAVPAADAAGGRRP